MDAVFAAIWGVLVATFLVWRFEALLGAERQPTEQQTPDAGTEPASR